VPGFTPHPVSDPRGHMHGARHESTPPLDPAAWQSSAPYLYAADLFNHGFYWEAHEAWESLWHAAGRRGPVAAWLKALIKLAAAGVKAREGNPAGVARHATRATELLAEAAASCRERVDRTFAGLQYAAVEGIAEALRRDAVQFAQPQPELTLPHRLELGDA
jgi:predicted metal-dependent hydrolase